MTARVCSTPGCPNLLPKDGGNQGKAGRCPTCRAKADRDRRPDGNPYSTTGHKQFREAVLAKDPVCVLCRATRATVADHYPTERRDLVDQGLNPNDPTFGRGLCVTCHNSKTARTFGFGGSHYKMRANPEQIS
ncbi:hypothetical protein GCM10009618_14930 [Nesterenkonia lacusekhoensis]